MYGTLTHKGPTTRTDRLLLSVRCAYVKFRNFRVSMCQVSGHKKVAIGCPTDSRLTRQNDTNLVTP